jgi:hypothetical protein
VPTSSASLWRHAFADALGSESLCQHIEEGVHSRVGLASQKW